MRLLAQGKDKYGKACTQTDKRSSACFPPDCDDEGGSRSKCACLCVRAHACVVSFQVLLLFESPPSP
jgi:hypothetical protein